MSEVTWKARAEAAEADASRLREALRALAIKMEGDKMLSTRTTITRSQAAAMVREFGAAANTTEGAQDA